MNFTNGAELLEYCEKEHKKISEAMFERETTFLEQDPEKTREKMEKAWAIMQASTKKERAESSTRCGKIKRISAGMWYPRLSPMQLGFSKSTPPWDSSLRPRRPDLRE